MSDHPQTPWLTGLTFDGRYTLGPLIARGGMAEVYHAVDLWSNNPVAVKALLPHLTADPAQRQKFFREGSALNKIRHRNVVGVLAEGTERVFDQQVMYLVLEYVHGSTLAQLLAARPVLSVEETLSIIIPAVEGLSEVHAHRLIHRDIKPANILLDDSLQTSKLSDFGLTRRADQSATGLLMGTPSFVAPEVLDVKGAAGPPADIFALGVVIYRMLTGRMPFAAADNDQQVLYHNANTDIPSVADLAPGLTPDLVGLVRWTTRRSPADRPQDATELYRALVDIQARSSSQDLAYRAPQGPEPELGLWEEVSLIAEENGMTHYQQSTPISAFSPAADLLDLSPSGPLERQPAAKLTQGPGEEELADDELEPAEEAQEAPSLPRLEAARQPGARSFSAQPSPAQPSPGQYSPAQQAPGDRGPEDHTAGQTPNPALAPEPIRRRPLETWQTPLSPASLLTYSLLGLLAFVAAGFIGWWLASLLPF